MIYFFLRTTLLSPTDITFTKLILGVEPTLRSIRGRRDFVKKRLSIYLLIAKMIGNLKSNKFMICNIYTNLCPYSLFSISFAFLWETEKYYLFVEMKVKLRLNLRCDYGYEGRIVMHDLFSIPFVFCGGTKNIIYLWRWKSK